MEKAIIILGHGSRQADADSTIRRIAADIRSIGGFEIVAHAFLQHTRPGPEEALEQCVKEGADMIVIVPFFLQPGGMSARMSRRCSRKQGAVIPELRST
ncbi:MAG: hypothetical protein A2010_18200 [Nitrospirae bacterium GWD2_57_9]|nr:MAG: hypothetical protein A2010_18200 [Nitrospirae bacterium GWD2_57_9]